MENQVNFEDMRNTLALKCVVTSDQIDMERRSDRAANPHNDDYKRPIRSEAEVVSDRSYAFADDFLKRQYGEKYQVWLQLNTFKDHYRPELRRMSVR